MIKTETKFQQTVYSILNVPNLRFPEFSDEWESIKASDLLEFYSTNSLSWEQLEYKHDGLYNLHYGLIHNGLPTQVSFNDVVLPSIKKEFTPRKYTLCKDGDVAFADASEDTNDVGKVVELLDCANKDIICGLHTIHGRDKHYKTIPGFKGYAFSSRAFHDQIKRIAQGTKVFSISTGSFDKIRIGIPDKAEQKKIAKLLLLIDQRIAYQNKVIEDLEKLKTSISLSFFRKTPQRRVPLASLIKYGKAGGTPKTINKSYYNGDIPFLSIKDITIQGKYIKATETSLSSEGLDSSSAWIVPAGSLILSMYASVGLPAINVIPMATSQAMFSMILNDKELVDYLYYYLCYYKNNHIHRYLETGTQSNINAEIVKSIIIPDYGDQNYYIGKMLSLIDNQINNEKRVNALFQKQKQSLLNCMFI